MALTWLQRGSLGVVLALPRSTITRVDAQTSSFQQCNASVLADALRSSRLPRVGAGLPDRLRLFDHVGQHRCWHQQLPGALQDEAIFERPAAAR